MSYSTIDIGAGAANYDSTCSLGYTFIDATNAANSTGILNSIELWFNSAGSGVVVGTFSGSSTSYDDRDYESIGSVTSGSKQTFTGKNCDVTTGDYIGIYFSGGSIEASASGGSGIYLASGNKFGGSSNTYYFVANDRMAIYATGVTVPDAPTNVSATDNLNDKVTITWTAGTGETGGHRVYRAGTDISGVIAHGTNTYNDTTAVLGTTYSYTVKAINDAGLSAASTADNGTRLRASRPPIFIF